MEQQAWSTIAAATLVTILLASCSATPPDVYGPVTKIDGKEGYYPRVETEGPDGESLFILTFSGGGKRASAYSQGVLEALNATNLVDGRTMLDEVDMISSVSGGSVPAANFVAHGAGSFETFREDFLYFDAMARLKQELLYTPAVLWSLLVENKRIEAFVDILEDHVVSGDQTYASLRPDAPYLIMNTTDIATGLAFPLTQYQFDVICSDLGQMPLARAVAASAAYPVLLSSIAIENVAPCPAQFRSGEIGETYAVDLVRALGYVGLMAGRTSAASVEKKPPIVSAGSAYKRERGQRMLRYIEREQDYQYLHLYDGGINDNVGLAEPLWLLTDEGGSWKRQLNDYLENDHLQRITVLTANARSDPDTDIPADEGSPNMLGVVSALIGASIDRRTTGLIGQLGLAKTIGGRKPVWGDMGFDRIKDRQCARRFANLPTDWALDKQQINALLMLGAAMTFATKAFRDQAVASGAVMSEEIMQQRSADLAERACNCIETSAEGDELDEGGPCALDQAWLDQ
jgi:NTE family protein